MDSVLIAALQVLCEEEKSNQVAFLKKKNGLFLHGMGRLTRYKPER